MISAIDTNVLVALWERDDTLNSAAQAAVALEKGYSLLTLDDGIYRAAFPKLHIVRV
jgi:predicted nucleic acid-binding protein